MAKPDSWPTRLLRAVSVPLLAAWVSVSALQPAAADDAVRSAIRKVMQEHFAACNEENMPRLLKTMSSEMPSKPRLITAIDSSWSVNDTHTVLEDVVILDDSDSPGAQFEHPYATANVTQTVIQLSTRGGLVPVFRRKCLTTDRAPLEIAEGLGIAWTVNTCSAECLFKNEDGEWKLVTGLTEPVPAGKDAGKRQLSGMDVPSLRLIKLSGSVFQ